MADTNILGFTIVIDGVPKTVQSLDEIKGQITDLKKQASGLDLGSEAYKKAQSDIKNVTGNVDLDFDSLEKEKKDRFYDAFDRGVIELPIVVKFGHSKYDLLGGNTRLAGLIMNGIDPYVWLVNAEKNEDDDESLELNEDKLKGGISDDKTFTK